MRMEKSTFMSSKGAERLSTLLQEGRLHPGDRLIAYPRARTAQSVPSSDSPVRVQIHATVVGEAPNLQQGPGLLVDTGRQILSLGSGTSIKRISSYFGA